LLTNLTVFLVTLMMYIFGTGEVENFAFAMTVAAIVGTYSSIFVAAPLALWIHVRFYEKSGTATAVARPGRGPAKPAEAEADEGDDDEGGAGARV